MVEEEGKRSRSGALEAAVVIPNVILLAVVIFYIAFTRIGGPKVEPLVTTDPKTADRITDLERKIQRGEIGGEGALELARLYSRAGEFPWSVDALRKAEQGGGDEPDWRMKLGLAYLELGKNIDSLRVLKGALRKCQKDPKCPANIRVKLGIFKRVTEILIERRIDPRKNQVAAAKVFDEVLKAVRPQKLSEPKSDQIAPDQPPSKAQPTSNPAAPTSIPASTP